MAAFIELTLKDGFRVLIGKAWVMSVTDDPKMVGIYGGAPAQCVVMLSGQPLAIQEPYAMVKQFLLQPD